MAKRIIFAALLATALAMFAWTVRRFGRMVLAGRPDNRFDRVGERLWSVLAFFLGQKKVVEKADIPAGRWPGFVRAVGSKYHVVIFWGFLIITAGTAELIVQGLFPSFSFALLIGESAASALNASIDVACAAVLGMLVFAVFRRTVLKPRLIPMSRDAAAILGAIAMLMISYFGMRTFAINAGAP